jgi:hypothetical protein
VLLLSSRLAVEMRDTDCPLDLVGILRQERTRDYPRGHHRPGEVHTARRQTKWCEGSDLTWLRSK